MLDWMFVILFVFGILLILISIGNDDNPFWNLTPLVMAIPLFFILGLSNMEIEIPYQMFNSSSGMIETGIDVATSKISPWLSYLFMGIGIVLMIYLIAMVFDKFYGWQRNGRY